MLGYGDMENKRELYSTIYLGIRHDIHFHTGHKPIFSNTLLMIVTNCLLMYTIFCPISPGLVC